MEGVIPKVRCLIIADFNGENVTKWKMFTIGHFKKMECKKKRLASCDTVDGCRRVSLADRKPLKLTLAK